MDASRPSLRAATLLGVLAIGLAGCSGPSASTGTDSGAGPAVTSPDPGSAGTGTVRSPEASSPPGGSAPSVPDGSESARPALPEVLRFEARTVEGRRFDASTLAGQDVVLWFWAPWCVICARSSSEVADYAANAGDDVTVVGVAGLSSNTASMRQFVVQNRVDGFDNLADTSGDLYTRFGIAQQHSFAFVDASSGRTSTANAYGGGPGLAELAAKAFG